MIVKTSCGTDGSFYSTKYNHCVYGQDLAGCGGQALPPRLEAELYSARLQLVIVSPVFLQWVYRNPALLVGRLLQQDRSVNPHKLPAKLSIIDNS